MILKKYSEQRHIDLDNGRSCLALEREYWPLTQTSPLPLKKAAMRLPF